jgi:hypothetical protein
MSDISRLLLVAALSALFGGATWLPADDDVTVVSSAPSNTKANKNSSETDSDGTPVVHKYSHKKKPTTQVASTSSSYGNYAAPGTSVHTTTAFASTMPHPVQFPGVYRPLPPAAPGMLPQVTAATATPSVTTVSPGANAPAVDTGLPVARYPGIAAPIPGVSTYQPPAHTYMASTTAMTGATLATTAVATYSVPYRPPPPPLSDFNFVSPVKSYHNLYPWKTGIVTTKFWIGEGSTPISSTDNVESSWDEEWLQKNHGSDNPYDRSGYASGSHASTLNPFYCALPFNDLAFPDQARVWLPRGWYRRPEDGRQISACKDRWVEIKNSRGDVCYAQWEDVGPLRYDDAAYVFGDERPIGLGDDRAGLDVSPAVYDYLGLGDRNHYSSWRFVDEADVRPGAWLKLDEQAVIFTALEQLKNRPLPSEPIQGSSEPIDDATLQANKKKVERAN